MQHEPALAIRMLVALALSALLLGACVAGCVWLAIFVPYGWFVGAVVLAFAVEGFRVSRMRPRSSRARAATTADHERVQSAVDRLSVVAGVGRPTVRVEPDRVPLSWTTALPPSRAAIHVSTGMLDRLEDRELHAVMAHELAHLVHRDAILMTALAGPPAYLLAGVREQAQEGVRGIFGMVFYGLVLGVPAALLLAVSRIVSRHRELVADRTAALLTGSPSSVGAALIAVSEGFHGLPTRDLRMAAPRDSLHFAPAKPPRRLDRLWATHPPVETRLERLNRVLRESS